MSSHTNNLVASISAAKYADNYYDWLRLNSDIFAYIIYAYQDHDAAHDIMHVIKVLQNAYEIMNRLESNNTILFTDMEKQILPWTILLHDSRDHKVVARGLGRPQEEINAIASKLFGTDISKLIEHIHNNCSWSKREKSLSVPANMYGISDNLRKLLCDADWIEAIGEIGLLRCREYQSLIFPQCSTEEITRKVYDHTLEKMIHIRTGLYFDVTRQIVDEQDLEAPLYEFIAKYESENM